MNKVLFVCLLAMLGGGAMRAQTKNSPQQLFNELWTLFDDRYSVFEQRNVDWDKVRAYYAPMVSDDMTDAALYDVCCAMIRELNDAHVTLIDKKSDSARFCNSFGFPDSTAIFKTFEKPQAFFKLVDSTLQVNGFVTPQVSEKFNVYSSSERLGYIRLNLMKSSYKGFANALDQLKDKEGLILDLRMNPGGNDYYLHRIAGRLVDEKQISHYKSSRIPKTDEFRKLKKWNLKPIGPYQYVKPIVILTSNFTASASEVFTMALKDQPHVTVVGTSTNGSFSNMYTGKLANGWKVVMSCRRTYSADMVIYEGKGIAPDVYIPHTDTSKDQALLKAIEMLMSK